MNTNNTEVTQEEWDKLDEMNRKIDEKIKETHKKSDERLISYREKLKYLSAFLDRLLIGDVKKDEKN